MDPLSASLDVPQLANNMTATTPQVANSSPKLHKAAQEFEALLVGEMLKSARESGSDGWLGSGESTGDDSAMDMAESQLANALSSGGGLGLASTIERAMSKLPAQNNAETQPAGSVSSPLNKP